MGQEGEEGCQGDLGSSSGLSQHLGLPLYSSCFLQWTMGPQQQCRCSFTFVCSAQYEAHKRVLQRTITEPQS